MECIRCGKCRQVCPTGAITTTWGDFKRSITQPDPQPETVEAAADAPVKAEAKKDTNVLAKIIGIAMILSAAYTIFSCVGALVNFAKVGFYGGDVTNLWAFAPAILPIFCAVLLLILGIKMAFAKDDVRITHQLNWLTLASVALVMVVYFILSVFALGINEMNILEAFTYTLHLITDYLSYYAPLIVLTILGGIATGKNSQ